MMLEAVVTLPIEQAAINCSRFAAGDFRVDAVIENIVERLGLEQTICAARRQVLRRQQRIGRSPRDGMLRRFHPPVTYP